MVVDVGRGSAPGDGHRTFQGQPERDAARPVIVRGRVRVVDRQREDDGHQRGVAEQLPGVDAVLPAPGRPQRGDQQPGRDEGEAGRRGVPDPERDPPRAGPQRQQQPGVQHDHAGGDPHPSVDDPALGGVRAAVTDAEAAAVATLRQASRVTNARARLRGSTDPASDRCARTTSASSSRTIDSTSSMRVISFRWSQTIWFRVAPRAFTMRRGLGHDPIVDGQGRDADGDYLAGCQARETARDGLRMGAVGNFISIAVPTLMVTHATCMRKACQRATGAQPVPFAARPANTAFSSGGGRERREHDHGHDRRERLAVEDRRARDHRGGADAREDQPHLAAGDHADADRPAVEALLEDGQRADLLAGDRGDAQARRRRGSTSSDANARRSTRRPM